jgi:phosphocarrier protein HPr
MQKRNVNVTNPLGIHARPSAKIVQVASKFRSRVSLTFNGHTANARNIVAVMLLAAGAGSTITVETIGPDESEAIEAVADLISSRFENLPVI